MEPADLASLIRTARRSAGLTLEETAERIGLTPGALSHIETGKRLPSASNAVAIASALGIDEQVVLEALDEGHRVRRMSSLQGSSADTAGASRSASRSPRAATPAAAEPAAARTQPPTYRRRDIRDLIPEPEGAATKPLHDFGTRPIESSQTYNRNLARWSSDTSARIEALGELASTAAEAIRTLRGLLEDEDPLVRREARRLLRELDVRLPEE